MALGTTVAWDVESGGSDTNGGGFDTSAVGTDHSQSTSPFTTFDGTIISATTAGVGATITLVGSTGATADIGNILNITGGTNFIVGRYQITNVGSTTWTLDRNCTSGAGAAMTGKMGGCFATIQAAIDAQSAAAIPEQTIWVKLGTYQITTALSNPTVGGGNSYQNRMLGYQSVHGDSPTGSNRPTIAVGTGAGINAINISTSNGTRIKNFIIDGTASSGTEGAIAINITASYASVINCKMMNFSGEGLITSGSYGVYDQIEVTGCAGSQGSVSFTSPGQFLAASYIHENSQTGVYLGSTGAGVSNCIIANNAGASSHGVDINNFAAQVVNCTIYGNGGDGVRMNQALGAIGLQIQNNLIAKNGGYGINFDSAPTYTGFPEISFNGFWSNTGGNYHNLSAGSGDVAVSVDPFVNDTGSPPDFSLNATASAGASMRGAGSPGTMPGLTSVGHIDIGALQHADAGGSGMLFVPNLEGV